MHRYETLFILHPDLPEAQVRETVDRVKKLIEGMQGQIAEVQDWGMRELAYPVEKQSRGIYVLAQYTARPEVVRELERSMKLSDEFLRFISVRMPQKRGTARRGTRRPQATEATEVPTAEQAS